MHRPYVRAILAVAVLTTGACSNDTLSSLTTPTNPTIFTDTFTGTLSQNGSFTHSFTTASLGAVTVTIVAAEEACPNNEVLANFLFHLCAEFINQRPSQIWVDA